MLWWLLRRLSVIVKVSSAEESARFDSSSDDCDSHFSDWEAGRQRSAVGAGGLRWPSMGQWLWRDVTLFLATSDYHIILIFAIQFAGDFWLS